LWLSVHGRWLPDEQGMLFIPDLIKVKYGNDFLDLPFDPHFMKNPTSGNEKLLSDW
jgi:hypothetical protein